MFVDALENFRVTRLFAVTSLVKNILSFVEMELARNKKTQSNNKDQQLLLTKASFFS